MPSPRRLSRTLLCTVPPPLAPLPEGEDNEEPYRVSSVGEGNFETSANRHSLE
jgi:hypothetical protein